MNRIFFPKRNEKGDGDVPPVLPSRTADWDGNVKALRTPDNLVAFPSASRRGSRFHFHERRNSRKHSLPNINTKKRRKGVKLINTKSKEPKMKTNIKKLIPWILPAALLLGCGFF